LEKILPHNLDAERAVLGALLFEPGVFDLILEILKPEDFFSEAHRQIYQAMLALEAKGLPLDIIHLTDHLKSHGALEKVGGPEVIAGLVDGVASAVGVEHWAKKVREKALLRRIISEASGIIEEAYGEPEELESFLDFAEARFLEIATERVERKYVSLPELLTSGIKFLEELAQKKDITGVRSGYTALDNLTNGFQPQDLIIIAGRPSMGKSALALNIARNSALEYGKTVAFFSLEMSREQLLIRLIAGEGKIDQNLLRTGFIPTKEWGKIISIAGKMSKAKIFIDDSSDLSVLDIKSRARRIKSEAGKIDLIIVDYLQIVRPSHSMGKRRESREQEVSEISRSLKALSKELKVPVIALSQLNRQVEHREDHKPVLADLRESGAIEQDADVIIFVHRPALYTSSKTRSRKRVKHDEPEDYNAYAQGAGEEDEIYDEGFCELKIAKQRNGPTGTVALQFFKQWARFETREARYTKEQIPEIP